MTPKVNTTPNESSNPPAKRKSTLVRWIFGVLFVLFALTNGFHYSSLFLLCAAFLMIPFSFVQSFFTKRNIKPVIAIVLSVVLFFTGVACSPVSDSSNQTVQTTPGGNGGEEQEPSTPNTGTTKPNTGTTKPNTGTTKPDTGTTKPNTGTTKPDSGTTKPDTGTTKPDTGTTKPDSGSAKPSDEQVTMVWVTSNGSKYHSKSSCSNMQSPRQISLENAQKQGYTACKKCY